MTQPTPTTPPPAPSPLAINQKNATNLETIRALLVLVESMKTNLTEAQEIGVAYAERTGGLRATPVEPGSLENYDYAVIEIGKNLEAVLEEVGRASSVVEQIHISMSEAKVGVDTLVRHQTEALRASAN